MANCLRTCGSLIALAVLSGCSAFTHMSDSPDRRHDEVAWRPDYATAVEDARRTDRPILAILVAGARTGEC